MLFWFSGFVFVLTVSFFSCLTIYSLSFLQQNLPTSNFAHFWVEHEKGGITTYYDIINKSIWIQNKYVLRCNVDPFTGIFLNFSGKGGSKTNRRYFWLPSFTMCALYVASLPCRWMHLKMDDTFLGWPWLAQIICVKECYYFSMK